MLKITHLPQIVQKHARNFKAIFSNKAQYQHFKQYLTRIGADKTCSGIQSTFIEQKSVNSLDHFLIHTQWSEVEMNRKRIKDLQNRPETTSRRVYCFNGNWNFRDNELARQRRLIPF
ncbi:MAG: hypothetical protein ACOY90_21380 [Candidatus Zhuqueibacterota bacterium]